MKTIYQIWRDSDGTYRLRRVFIKKGKVVGVNKDLGKAFDTKEEAEKELEEYTDWSRLF